MSRLWLWYLPPHSTIFQIVAAHDVILMVIYNNCITEFHLYTTLHTAIEIKEKQKHELNSSTYFYQTYLEFTPIVIPILNSKQTKQFKFCHYI